MVEQRTLKPGLASVVRGNKNVGPGNRGWEIASVEKLLPRSRLVVPWYQDFHSAVLQNCNHAMVVEISGRRLRRYKRPKRNTTVVLGQTSVVLRDHRAAVPASNLEVLLYFGLGLLLGFGFPSLMSSSSGALESKAFWEPVGRS